MAVTEVKVHQDNVRLHATKRCGGAFESVASVELPEQVEVYRIKDNWGEAVACSEAERERWSEAASIFLAAVSRALEELYRAHGGRGGAFDLEQGTGAWRIVPAPRHWPGWKQRAVERSEAAQRAFLTEVQRAREAYRPVREEIDRRLAEQRAAREEAERARAREAQQRRAVLVEVAARRVWLYEVGEEAGEGDVAVRVRVFRTDLPPIAADRVDPPQEPLTARELEKDLYALARAQEAGGIALRWDEAARAAVEEECLARGVSVVFAQWWREMALHSWSVTEDGPQPVRPSPPGSGPRPSFGGTGMGGTGGFTGGHSYGGFGGY
ncbi:hypothetical protein ACIBJD_18360 [Kitasatospora sp. NPDC050467]|uniref:hypothetical protein n=1 Tax=Kitasatospora sp. NPDC050467 TaxID=3364053 RepID=UPI00379D7319